MPGKAPSADKSRLALMCWLPLICLVAIEIYVRSFDGWGAWAAAPLFLLPLVLSAVIAGAGLVQCFFAFRAGLLQASSVVYTGIAMAPLVWLFIRRFFA